MNNKTSAVIRLVLYSIVALALTGVMVWGIVFNVGGFFNISKGNIFSFNTDELKNYDTAGTATFNSSDITSLDIDWPVGNVVVKKGSGNSVFIEETSDSEISENFTMRYKNDNGNLRIHYCGTTRKFSFQNSYPTKTLTVTLPNKVYDTLEIDTSSAVTSISDVSVNDIDFDGVSGDFSFVGTLSNELSVDIVSGEFNFSSAVCPDNISFNSVSGNAAINIPASSSFSADMATVSGAFSSDFVTTMKNDEYLCGNGDSDFSFNSVSGNVKIMKNK